MPPPQPVALTPVRISPGDATYQELLGWPFASAIFYEAQAIRLLQTDIPNRVASGVCAVWAYRDPNGDTVGFGTLHALCKDYEHLTGGKVHCYIPLLAVNPAFQKRGHGRTIVEHLTAEAVLLTLISPDVSDRLYLDVYTANQGAISLYQKCGFVALNMDAPIPDPQENNETYIVMATNIAGAPMQSVGPP